MGVSKCLPLLNVYSEDSEGDSCCLISCTKEFIAYKPLLDCLSFMHLVVSTLYEKRNEFLFRSELVNIVFVFPIDRQWQT